MSKRISFPSFGSAFTTATEGTPIKRDQPKFDIPARQKDFCGAAYNLLACHFRKNFAEELSEDEYDLGFHSENGCFSMYFFIKPDSKFPCDGFVNAVRNFMGPIWQIIGEQELHHITAEPHGSTDSPIFVLRSVYIHELMAMMESLFTPYNMNLSQAFMTGQHHSRANEDSFQFDPLYSLCHVRELYQVAMGMPLKSGDGLHLSH